jgi:glycosyltransferase involved in cell wall biosynthesis
LRRLHIALVAQPFDGVLPPYQNSIGIWLHEIARRLARTHEVSVYMRSPERAGAELWQDGVRFRQVTLEPDRIRDKIASRLWRAGSLKKPAFASRGHFFGYALQIALDVRRHGCNLVLLLNFSQFVPVIRFFNPGVKIVLNMRCEWLSQLDRRLIAPRLARTDSIIGCSHHITDRIREAFPEFGDRAGTIFNGIDVDRYASASPPAGRTDAGAMRLLFVGRVSPEKGVHVLLAALREVVDAVPDASLTVVGGHGQLPYEYLVGLSDDGKVSDLARFYRGPARDAYIEHLRGQLRELDLTERVTFTGLLPYAEVIGHYRTATVLVNPSFSESFGRSPVEAMASGLPVIGTRVGGMLDTVVDGETGRLVPAGDAASLAAAILQLHRNPRLRERMGEAGRERAQRLFAWDRIAAQWRDLYEGVCAGHA